MSEDTHNEDSFDKLFREKAGDYNISYNEEDWLKLEKKLDARDAQIAGRRKQWLLLAASFLIISLLGYFTFDNYNRLNQLSRQLTEEPATGENQPPTGEELTVIPGDSSAVEEESEPASEPDEFAQVRPENVQPESVDEQPVLQSSELQQREEFAEIEYRDAGIVFTAGYSLRDENADADRVDPAKRVETVFSKSVLFQNEDDEENFPVTDADNEPVLAMGDSDNIPGRTGASRAAVSFLVSPDLSTAGSLSNFYDPGYKIGFTFEYQLTPRLAVSAGALQSKVRYTAPGNVYDPPPYWNSGVAPDEITGVCLLIDIPVTFKYNVMEFSRSRLFATAGISSYIMLQEDYRFDYDNYSGGLAESWSDNTGTRHWLSNAGFSIGYELDIHPNWSLRAEPFLKVPVKEVGWGNVKLYSIGSFVSVNYKL